MGRLQLHFAKYMGSYAVLMAMSFLLWQIAGYTEGQMLAGAGVDVFARTMRAASDFLIDFAAIAYPLYAAIAMCIKNAARSSGLRHRPHKRTHDANDSANAVTPAA